MSDWIGTRMLRAFSWRNGQDPETIGIWMWPEIFTHIQPDGEKVAIILIDTQGIFDSQSSTKDYVATFAISLVLSSVLCLNKMQRIQENDLQYLELFTEYGRLVMEQTNEKPFEELLFVVRDWPYSHENDYGYSPEYVEETLKKKNGQTPEMHELRDRIISNFNKIKSFLMPHPGKTVATGNAFQGVLSDVHPKFVKYVNELTTSIFAPDKLVVKQINGKKLRPSDFISFIQEYVAVFNSEDLPEPLSIFMVSFFRKNSHVLTKHKNCYIFLLKIGDCNGKQFDDLF